MVWPERNALPVARSHRSRFATVVLSVAAKSEGITRIDSVILSEHGDRAFVEQKGSIPGINDKIASVETAKAIHITTIAHGTAALVAANQQQHGSAPVNAQTSSPSAPEPTISSQTR
jgi:hypothetical protein